MSISVKPIALIVVFEIKEGAHEDVLAIGISKTVIPLHFTKIEKKSFLHEIQVLTNVSTILDRK